eukprot:GHVP01060961.1.p1 GENE.GHVP01060961.1~~GHVP01060961.1.p1  ORF type:complete len:335 (+),score=39.59 GHVP01060961.1:131-1135(+)
MRVAELRYPLLLLTKKALEKKPVFGISRNWLPAVEVREEDFPDIRKEDPKNPFKEDFPDIRKEDPKNPFQTLKGYRQHGMLNIHSISAEKTDERKGQRFFIIWFEDTKDTNNLIPLVVLLNRDDVHIALNWGRTNVLSRDQSEKLELISNCNKMISNMHPSEKLTPDDQKIVQALISYERKINNIPAFEMPLYVVFSFCREGTWNFDFKTDCYGFREFLSDSYKADGVFKNSGFPFYNIENPLNRSFVGCEDFFCISTPTSRILSFGKNKNYKYIFAYPKGKADKKLEEFFNERDILVKDVRELNKLLDGIYSKSTLSFDGPSTSTFDQDSDSC